MLNFLNGNNDKFDKASDVSISALGYVIKGIFAILLILVLFGINSINQNISYLKSAKSTWPTTQANITKISTVYGFENEQTYALHMAYSHNGPVTIKRMFRAKPPLEEGQVIDIHVNPNNNEDFIYEINDRIASLSFWSMTCNILAIIIVILLIPKQLIKKLLPSKKTEKTESV